MAKPRALDLFCCAGGATRGLQNAGFHVTGVDIKPQPRYCGDEFHQADALTFPTEGFDFIWASPPCQKHSITRHLHVEKGAQHPDLIEATREKLQRSGLHYVIENVVGAPLIDPFRLCGTMFDLRVFRHRLFESNFFVMVPDHKPHQGTTNSRRRYSQFATGADMICCAGHNFRRADGAIAMDMHWPMTRKEMAQAIPPAFSEFIAREAIRQGCGRLEAA